jgi:hypothetical protein
MSDFQIQSIEKAKQFRQQLGGTIFAFPIEEDNPFSKYAVVRYFEGEYFSFPDALNISEASAGVLAALEGLKERGLDSDYDYERNARIISYQAQMDAPSTTMRRLKKENVSKPFLRGTDVSEESEEGDRAITARGLIKMSYLMVVDENNPKASLFMDEYYKLLAMRKYGKKAAAIKQEVRRMGKDQAVKWIEQTYEKYIHDDMEIMGIFNSLK